MITKKTFVKVIPAVALACGALAFNFLGNGNGLVETKAADYSTSNRKITINNDKSIDASFYLDNSIGTQLDMRGWLLCLFETQPDFDPVTRKLNNSDTLHPGNPDLTNVAHYYYAANNDDQGNISVNWSSTANDQKILWSTDDDPEEKTTGNTLGEVLDAKDWYIVVGPRHYYANWAAHSTEYSGAGKDGYWENCDYYVGRKSNIENNYPSGEIYIDLTEYQGWEANDAKFAVWFWNKNNENVEKGFSLFAAQDPTYKHIYVASYELGFNPTNMTLASFNSSATSPDWNKKVHQTQDLAFHQHAVIGVTGEEESGWENQLSTVKITGKDDVVLDHYKRNLSNKSEHYNDGVELTAGDTFYIDFAGNHFDGYSTLTDLSGAFEKDGNLIKVKTTGSYAFYFDTSSGAENLYITDPAIAAADRWAQSFMNVTCDDNKEDWWNYRESYSELSYNTREFFRTAKHKSPDEDLTSDSYVNQAVQRYDYVLSLYGTSTYSNFMNRTIYNLSGANANELKVTNTNTNTIVIIVGASATAILAGALFLLKKKKYE